MWEMASTILQTGTFFGFSFDEPVVQLAMAAALGLFLGLEREWSEKPAGIRTFSLTCLLGALFTVIARETQYGALLIAIGGLFVISQSVLIGVQGLLPSRSTDSLSLTTSVSMLVTYGVGILVASGFVLEGVTVAVV